MNDKFNEKMKTLPAFFKKNGAYLVLFLCLGVTALAVALLVPSSEKPSDDGDTVGGSNDQRLVEVTYDPHETIRPIRDALNSTHMPDFTATPTATPTQKRELLPAPVTGDIILGFAINELIYSVTLDQWTTHAGVDIACKLGSSVRAVADGTVEKVYTDTGLGVTVVIAHTNGDNSKSVYANLANDSSLPAEGATVKANDVIGISGNTAKFESAQKAHIHFEYHVNGQPVNPANYVMFVAGS